VFLTRNQAFSNSTKQKNIFAGLEAFFYPKNRPGYKSEGGAKFVQGGPKYLQGGSCPLPPTFRAYEPQCCANFSFYKTKTFLFIYTF